MRRCRWIVPGLVALLCAAMVSGGAHAAGAALTLLSKRPLDHRLWQLSFQTPALKGPTGVRVLLPDGYARNRNRRYPVLYLLHGTSGDDTDWTTTGKAETLTAGLPLIVVMPSGGQGGFYTNWFNNGLFGPPEWETYHIDQLVPWVDAHYRTIAARRGRGIAGLSMGGFGAMSYAARHPDLFVAAAAFSGAVNTNEPPLIGEPDESLFDHAFPGDNTWGLRFAEEIYARAHNPWDLAANLRGLAITLRTGNGLPGGPYPYNLVSGVIEVVVHLESSDLNSRLNALGIPHTWQDYGAGDHSWPYWNRDLALTLTQFMSTFAHPPAPPSPLTFRSADPTYETYGWTVRVARPAMEWSTLSGATRAGFTLSGSGVATVITPPSYKAGASYPITVSPAGVAPLVERRSADSRGRLSVTVPLGPGNRYQQYTLAATLSGGTRVYSTTVRVPTLGVG